jgi:DNA-binding NarL/FixJ family response regulator
MPKKITRILLLEDHLADAAFLREALNELEELHQGHTWLSPFEIIDAETLEEARALLAEVPIDVVLADLWLPDSQGMATFQHLRAAAPAAPILVLLGADDPTLTVTLIQAGAQDVLVKHEVDCMPLGRSLRCAMERNRIASGLRRLSTRDELSGLPNAAGLVQLGDGLCRLLRHLPADSLRASCGLLEVSNLPAIAEISGAHEEEWLIVELSELLKSQAADADVLAYSARGRFHLFSPNRSAHQLQPVLNQCARRVAQKAEARGLNIELQFRTTAAELGPAHGFQFELLLDDLDASLWDNSPLGPLCEADTHTMIQ